LQLKNLALIPASYDPITNGHIDIIERASTMFDELVIVVAVNPAKKTMFTADERCEMVTKSLGRIIQNKNGVVTPQVIAYDGLMVDLMEKYDARAMVRGIRAVSDMEYEFQLAYTNRQLSPKYSETVFLMPSVEYTYISSSLVRNVVLSKGDVSRFVPDHVKERLLKKMGGIA
jgi:pantetheine-phosphate adenylyltransferase